ncbi:DUF4912 domain-containing protein [Clostridium sp. CX1]|uniref:DUF4912 domain-containing protein n=1 Tax=Clostridium sp. CX1 TaxID=2978346 RepID=UPI0021BE5465|nr:DUF4912 domain-containing protein [Clostridium sp. CX1]MCT8978142.1 DUF4912 domain-containing protein [Clostridium sp. CX1]
MLVNEKSKLILMVQSAKKVFCYFNVSPMTVKEFEDRYGENSWKNSKPVLKVYSVENGIPREIKTIFIDAFANNWYIDMDKGDLDIFIKMGRVLPDNTFAAFAVSNTVTTPRDLESADTSVYFVDLSQKVNFNSEVALPRYEEDKIDHIEHKEPKPYPFSNIKKNTSTILK